MYNWTTPNKVGLFVEHYIDVAKPKDIKAQEKTKFDENRKRKGGMSSKKWRYQWTWRDSIFWKSFFINRKNSIQYKKKILSYMLEQFS